MMNPYVAGIAALAMIGLVGGAYQYGRQSQRSETIEVRNDILKERLETNATVNRLDDGGLCAALNGRVMPDGKCE